MGKRYLLLAGIVSFICNCLPAQTPSKKQGKKICSCGFGSINQAGLLEGSTRSSFQLQTINGIRYKTWFAGAGVGLDYYHVRSIPVFLDVRKTILAQSNTPFVYMDGGWHFPWASDGNNAGLEVKYASGLYYDLGLGYRVALANKSGLLLSVGYTYKSYQEKRISKTFCFDPPCPGVTLDRYNYKLNRFTLKVGWEL